MSDEVYDEDGLTPDLDEVQQHEPVAAVLDVDVKGPVQAHALPARHAVMHSTSVGTGTVQLLGRDQRRGRVLLWAHAAAGGLVYVGTRDDEVTAGTAAVLVAGPDDGTAAPMVVELRHCEPVYVRAASGSVTVSFVAEQWAD